MYKLICEKLKNKNIAILGFGKEGLSTYNFIRKYMGDTHLTILDQKDKSEDPIFANDNNISFICGDNYMDNLDDFDLIIKAPGVSMKNISSDSIKSKITSQIELLLEVFKDNIIGVTGTKGKSTTSSLIYEVLKDQGYDTYLVGNISTPVLEYIEKYNEKTLLVIEMSSHQLEFLNVSPHIGVVLNLFEDHLDHAGSLKHYHECKMKMFKNQTENDIMLYSDDNKYLKDLVDNSNFKAQKYNIRFDNLNNGINSTRISDGEVSLNGEIIYVDGPRKLIGNHNLKNIMFVMTIARLLNLDLEKAKESISNFAGLKYRMEKIGDYHGITFYNDTIATIPEATMNAINAIGNVDTLIFGGMDRGISYDEFKLFLCSCKVNNLICMPTTGINIGKYVEENSNKNIIYVNTLEEAYNEAIKCTEKGKSCILSPAASSYEFYKNFEEKGKAFEDLVKLNK